MSRTPIAPIVEGGGVRLVDLPEPDLRLTLGRRIQMPAKSMEGGGQAPALLGDQQARAAGGLRAVERGVGGAEQVLDLVAVGGKRGDPAGKARRADGLLAVLHVELRG